MGDTIHYRAYTKYFNRDDFVDQNGKDADDEARKIQWGFRMDWEPSEDDTISFQGDVYNGKFGQTASLPARLVDRTQHGIEVANDIAEFVLAIDPRHR